MARGSDPDLEEAVHDVPPPARADGERVRTVPALSARQQAGLLLVARLAVAAALDGRESEDLRAAMGALLPIEASGGVFVTLTQGGELRGCTGTLGAGPSLAAATVQAAIWAADDPRFVPLTPRDLATIDVEVSALGPMVRLHDPMAFVLGEDGVVVERLGRRGVLLPEVASLHGLSRAEMLETAARKAGLPSDAVHDPRTVVHAFRTLRFGSRRRAPEP